MSSDEVTKALGDLADLRDRGAITPRSTRPRSRSCSAACDAAARSVVGASRARAAGSVAESILVESPSLLAVMLLVAFPIHEFSHALAAYRLGDGTAKLLGRLTLNPIVHFDPVGGAAPRRSRSCSLGFGFGWAKPTPVNPMNLRGGRRGEAIVAAAGPLSNLVLAVAAAIPLRVHRSRPAWTSAIRRQRPVPLRPDQPRC